MSMLKTFRLWLESDEDFPRFQRLRYEKVDVSLRDVLLGGVHPWTENKEGTDVHPSLIDALLQRLNDSGSKFAEFDGFGYSHDVTSQQGYFYQKGSRFVRNLDHIGTQLYFVDRLSYVELLEEAKAHLREHWRNDVALRMLNQMSHAFPDQRRFLKEKDKTIKLSGRDSLADYDLGQILSLEDFEGRENIIIQEAFGTVNLRKAAFLAQVTDAQGRLRLTPDIRRVTFTLIPQASNYVHLLWHVEREGEVWRFRPEIGKSDAKRRAAMEFAQTWRTDEGRLCFSTTLDRMEQMMEERIAVPGFPALNYTFDHRGPRAAAEVAEHRVPAFFIGGFHSHKSSGETLREILREYGVPMTGNKGKLLQKLAHLAAKQYEIKKPDMDAYFAEDRFVRIAKTPVKSERLPLLEDMPLLRNLLLTMYAMQHLRGNAILDVAHDNNTYTEEQLAQALLTGRVEFTGAFLRVA